MKKVLFATTALIATAGMATAGIDLSGSARFGVVYMEGAAPDEVMLHNRFTLNIDGSTETDDGLNFFARVRVRGGNTGSTGLAASGVSAPRVGVSTGGFTFAAGNIVGAVEAMPGLYDGAIGLTGLGWGNVAANTSASAFAWDSFSSAGAGSNGVELIYASGAFSGHLSRSESSDLTAAHIAYSFGDWTVALGGQEAPATGTDIVVATVSGSFGNIGVGASIGEVGSNQNWRLNASVEVGAGTTIAAYVADDELATDVRYGLGFTHSLGGATLAGGVVGTATGTTRADLGVRFNF